MHSPERASKKTESEEIPNCSNAEKMDAAPRVDAVNMIKLTQFYSNDPELWFTQIDGLLHVNRITSDLSKFYTVITSLDPETVHQIADVAKNPPEKDKYEKLKRELIARFGESKERQLLKLVTGIDLSNKRPSQLLHEMRILGGESVTFNASLTTLWMQKMSNNVRCIISVCKGQTLDNLAEIADRVIDNSPSTQHAMSTSAGNNAQCDAIAASKTYALESRVTALETSLQQVIQKLSDISIKLNYNERQSRSRQRSQSRPQQQKVCYYHIRYGNLSQKCRQPCDFNSKKTNNTTENANSCRQ